MTNKICITNCSVLPYAAAPILKNHYVVIGGSAIADLGPMAGCPDVGSGWTIIDAQGKLLMPGLVNGHNHSAMTLFRGIADDLALDDWLHGHIFPAEAVHVNPEMVYWCAKLAGAEMIRSGTTCVADGYFFSAEAARAFMDIGLRAVVGHGVVDFAAPSVPDPTKNIETVDHFVDEWQGTSPLITPAVFAHAPYTCSPATLQKAKRLADTKDVRFFIHLAESKTELEQIIDPRGRSPVKHLQALGLLDSNCTGIHTIWVDDEDMDILADSGAAIVTCPQSNAKLAAGVAPVHRMFEKKITIGLGTDGCASNNSLDMFREMDMLAKIQKLSALDATAMSSSDVLTCATSAGAAAIGLNGFGRIELGGKADLILIDIARPHLTPMYNQDLLVYAATGNDVDTSIINGKLIMHRQNILSFDVDETLHHVRTIAEALLPL